MQRTSRLTAAVLAGLIAAGSLAATVATAAPAMADDHRGGWSNQNQNHRDDRGRFQERRDWQRDYRPAPVYSYNYPAPVYSYPAPAYPYPYYAPSNGYIQAHGPGWSVGFSL